MVEGLTVKKWLIGVLAIESLSILAYFFPYFTIPIFIAVILGFTYAVLKNYTLGVLVALTELFIGSQGHILTLTSIGLPLSVRMALFLVLLVLGFVHARKSLRIDFGQLLIDNWPIWLWLGFVVIAVFHGILSGFSNPTIFFDANNYFFLLFILPLIWATNDKSFAEKAMQVFVWSAIYLSVKTLLLEYIFTHGDYELLWPDIYTWLRDSRIAEITFTSTGAYRIFMQSQIFLLPAWWIFIWHMRQGSTKALVGQTAMASLLASGILISFSRSFWLGWMLSCAGYGIWLAWRREWGVLVRTSLLGSLSVIVGVIFVWLSIQIPIPSAGRGSLDLAGRFNLSGEAAASSRWNMLGPLWSEIAKSPILGQGIGSSVTYISDDPRVRVVSPDGTHTATSFEWGYLDQWLDLGFIAVMLVIGLAVYLISNLFTHSFAYAIPLAFGVLAFYGTHIGTPYLNHPLGLIYILLLWVFVKYDRNTRQLA